MLVAALLLACTQTPVDCMVRLLRSRILNEPCCYTHTCERSCSQIHLLLPTLPLPLPLPFQLRNWVVHALNHHYKYEMRAIRTVLWHPASGKCCIHSMQKQHCTVIRATQEQRP